MSNSTKTTIKKIGVWVVVVGFIAFVADFLYDNPEYLELLFSLSIVQMSVLVFVSILIFLGLGMQSVLMLIPYGKNLPLAEAFQLAVANNLLNYLPLKSGAVGKGLYLKVTHQLGLKNYVAALTAGQMLSMMMSGLLGFVAVITVLVIHDNGIDGPVSAIALLLALASLCCYLLFFHSKLFLRLIPFTRIQTFVQQFSEAIYAWHPEAGVIRRFGFMSIALFLVFAFKIWFSFRVLGEDISLLDACFLQACVAVSFAFSVVPGNLGIREGLLVGLSALLQIDVEIALLAALIDRAAILLPALILGPLFLHRLGRNVQNLSD